jgi:hypothetical protein
MASIESKPTSLLVVAAPGAVVLGLASAVPASRASGDTDMELHLPSQILLQIPGVLKINLHGLVELDLKVVLFEKISPRNC